MRGVAWSKLPRSGLVQRSISGRADEKKAVQGTTCARCAGKRLRVEIIKEYQDDGLIGLPGVVVLDAARKYVCEYCGEENGISIADEEGLEAAAALARVGLPIALRGSEIRFLRRALGFTARQLAEYLPATEESVSRWENDKHPMGAQNEKILRLLVARMLRDRAPAIGFDELAILKGKIKVTHPKRFSEPKLRFRRVRIQSKPAWAEPEAA
jgi:DNA-binding transcriptional regulator YiaG